MVEAAIAIPLIILAVMLMIRYFVFCFDVLTSAAKAHENAYAEWDRYNGKLFEKYEDNEKVYLIRGGLLLQGVQKDIQTEMYLFNEDYFVRAGELLDSE